MNRMLALPLLFLLGALPCGSQQQVWQTPPTPAQLAAQAEAERDELLNLEHETVAALRLHNPTFFKRVYSDDFLGTVAYGQVMDKSTMIADVQKSEFQYSTFVVSDIRVRIFQETAVVTSLWGARGTFKGRSFARQSRVMHIYVFGMNGWKAVASQETLLPG